MAIEEPRAPAEAGRLARLAAVAERGLRLFLGALLIVMTAVNVDNAALRYAAGLQMRGSDEFLAFTQLAIVMHGLALVTALRRHLAVDLFAARSGPLQAARRLTLDALMVAVTTYAAVQSWSFVARMWAFGSTSMGLGVPMVIPHAAVFVGFALTALVALALLVFDLMALARLGGGREGGG
jgi:TRAP-type C4-dicarboxylate transport system permease small subunit